MYKIRKEPRYASNRILVEICDAETRRWRGLGLTKDIRAWRRREPEPPKIPKRKRNTEVTVLSFEYLQSLFAVANGGVGEGEGERKKQRTEQALAQVAAADNSDSSDSEDDISDSEDEE